MKENSSSDYDEIVKRITVLLGTREQSDLTDYLGLKKYAVTEWKNGKSTSFKKYLVKIAEFFNVSLDYLVLGKQTFALSEDEETILKMYRYIDDKDKPSARKSVQEIASKNISNARQELHRQTEQADDYGDEASIARMYDWLDPDEQIFVKNMIEEQLSGQTERAYWKYRNMGKEYSKEAVGIVNMYGWLDESGKKLIAKSMKSMIDRQLENALLGLRETEITFAVARSDDNESPRVITNDLDDILNAPDATDEY